MTDLQPSDSGELRDEPGKTRTWWHPLLARLLDHASGTAYQVLEEVYVGKLPLRVDILLIRREAGQLSEANRQELVSLLPLLNRFTLIQFKGPTDALQQVEQFRRLGEVFAMQHKDVKYMGEVEEELQMAVLEAISPDKRVRGLSPEKRMFGLPLDEWLQGLTPEERLCGLQPKERLYGVSFEELVGDLTEEQRAQLRAALERQSD